MVEIIPAELKRLAAICPTPLYVVGGSARDFLAGLIPKTRDWDICAPLPADRLATLAASCGILPQAVYKNTGTVKLLGKQAAYEYSCFRSDEYVRGTHVPVAIYFTDDIRLDAKRRDFTANAVYFDIRNRTFVDPLNGIAAIREKRLTTADNAKKVFGEDGLRLMRLARQAAQLGFSPDAECLEGAKTHAALIADISPERIYEELLAILTADEKYGVKSAPYHGLRLLDETRVLDYIIPELSKGRALAQRPDFHKHDVLEHSLRAVSYMEKINETPTLRLAALLHDIGKPLCMLRDGNAYAHPEEGELLALEILQRLKAPKATAREVAWLVKNHQYDYNCKTSENKLRRFLVRNAERIPTLLAVKQADFSACADDISKAPTCARWETLLHTMQEEGVPFSLKALAVNGKDIQAVGVSAPHTAAVLNELLLHVAIFPKENTPATLLKLARSFEKNLFPKKG